jgi:hypothetical protein
MENVVKYSDCIDGNWEVACFYKTDDESVVLYTAE